jgi:hypothetical protein
LSPRSPATCRHRSRPSGSPATPALRPRPAATNPASTGAQGQQESRHWAASHHATQSAPAQGKAHTAAVLHGILIALPVRTLGTELGDLRGS